MAGPGGKEVGRLSLKILPDTSLFEKSLRRYVTRIEKSVVVELPVQLNTKTLPAEIEAVQKIAEKVGSIELQIKFQKESIGKVLAELEAVAADREIEINVTPDVKGFINKVQAAAEKAAIAAQVKIPLGLEGDMVRAEMGALITEIEATSKIEVNTDLDATLVRTRLLTLLAEMESLARINPPTVTVDLDTGKARAGFIAMLAQMKLADAGASHVGRQIALWGPLIFIAAAGIAAIGPALAALVPLFGGIVASIAVIALGFKQLKTTFKPVVDGFKEMRDAIGNRLVAGLTPFIQTFTTKFLPVVEKGLLLFADLINGALKGLLGFLNSGEGLSLMGQFLTGIATALKPFAALAAPLTEMFLRLSIAALPALEMMGDALLRVTNRFNNFLAAGGGTSTITKSMQDLGQILSILGSVGSSAFKALFAAVPAVIGALSGMRDVLNVVFRAAQPVFEFMSKHTKTMRVLGAVVLAVALVIGTVSAAIALLGLLTASTFGLIAAGVAATGVLLAYLYKENQTFRTVVNAAWAGIKVAFAALVAAFKVGFAVVSAIVSAIGAVIQFLMPVFKVVFAVLATAFKVWLIGFKAGFAVLKAVVSVVIAVFKALPGIFGAVFGAATTVVTTAGNVIGGIFKVLATVIGAVIGVIVGIVRALLPVFQIVFLAIQIVVLTFIGAFKLAYQIVAAIIGGIITLLSPLALIFQAIFGFIKNVIVGFQIIFGLVFRAVMVVVNVFAAIFSAAFGRVRVVASVVGAAFRAFGAVVKAALSIVQSVVGGVVSFIRSKLSAVGGLLSAAGALWRLFSTAVSGALDKVKAVLTTVRDKVKSAINDPLGMLKQVGKDIINGLVNGIEAAARKAVDAVKNVGSKVKGAAKSILKIGSPSKVFRDEVGQWIPKGIAVGIEQYANVVPKAIAAIANDIPTIEPSVSMGNVDAAGAALAGAINATVSANGQNATRFVMEDWSTGTGYFTNIAEDQVAQTVAINRIADRMGVPA